MILLCIYSIHTHKHCEKSLQCLCELLFVYSHMSFVKRSAVLITVTHNDSIILCNTHIQRTCKMFVCVWLQILTDIPSGKESNVILFSTQLSTNVNLCHPPPHTHTQMRVCIFSFCGWVSKSAISINGMWQPEMTAKTGHTEITEARHTLSQTQAILI